MTNVVVAGTPTPERIDWSMHRGADFVVPMLWSKSGIPVDLTNAVVTITFSPAPHGGVVPRTLSTAAPNADGGTIVVGVGTAASNMTVRLPAAATALYDFRTIRYVMIVNYPGSGILPWAEGDVSFTEGAATPG